MRYCKSCLFPSTKPDLYFDKVGVCDSCRSAERKHGITDAIDWDKRALAFSRIVEESTNSNIDSPYDCIVPVSGGKDSTWQVLRAKHFHGLKVLAITFDQFDQTPTGRHNLDVLRDVGVDHIHFTLSPLVVKKLVLKGFKIVGDPYWVNHVGMFTIPFRLAVNLGVKLIIYGESPQLEYGGPESSRDNRFMDSTWLQEFGGMRGLRIDDMLDAELTSRDLAVLKFPTDEQLTDASIRAIFYGAYYRWDVGIHLPIVQGLGWKALENPPTGSWVTYENCDMQYIDIRERIKYLKYGYGRATDQLNIEIRNGRISRQLALEIAKEIDGQVSAENEKHFCNYLGLTEDEYLRIVDSFVNRNIFKSEGIGKYSLIEERV
jgi:N-acetyl sugar amidotransferase